MARREARRAGTLKDYSGKFEPNIKLSDFSEEALRAIWKCGGGLYTGLQSIYMMVLAETFGMGKALEISKEVWLKKGGVQQEVRLIRQALGSNST